MAVSPSHALNELLAQHAALRTIIDRCVELVAELENRHIEAKVVIREVARLRVAFAVHNNYEEQFLRPVLADLDSFSDARLEHLAEEHAAEHAVLRHELGDETLELRETLQHLKDHLEREERYFLSSRVLRNDIVVVEDGG